MKHHRQSRSPLARTLYLGVLAIGIVHVSFLPAQERDRVEPAPGLGTPPIHAAQESRAPVTPQDKHADQSKRIVFLGDSITHAGSYIELLEYHWWQSVRSSNSQAKQWEWINLGLPSETCSGLSEPDHPFPRPDVHERLRRALDLTKPDVVVACYGMNDGIYHPLDAQRLAAYRAGLRRLVREVHLRKCELILMTPPPFDPVPLAASGKLQPAGRANYSWKEPYAEYDEVLREYSRALQEDWQGHEQVAAVVDLNAAVSEALRRQRREEPKFSFAQDGIHPDANGHRALASAILKAWPWQAPAAGRVSKGPVLTHGNELRIPQPSVRAEIHRRQQLLHEAWLSHVGHQRPGMRQGLPLAKAQAEAVKLLQKIQTELGSAN